jgi:hypothetical protein
MLRSFVELTPRIETPRTPFRSERRQSALTRPSDDSIRKRESRLTAWIRITTDDETTTAEYSQVVAAIGTRPGAIERFCDGDIERFTRSIETHLEARPPLDTELWKTALVALLIENDSPRRKTIAIPSCDVHDLSTSTNECTIGLRTCSDRRSRNAPWIRRITIHLVKTNLKSLVVIACLNDAVNTIDRNRFGTSEPRDGLIAIDIVDEHRVVWFHDYDYGTATCLITRPLEVSRTLASEDTNSFSHNYTWSRSPL